MLCAGIDAGSRTIKIALVESKNLKIIGTALQDQGVEQNVLAGQLFDSLLDDLRLNRKDIGAVVATGYGRHALTFVDTTITEITCQAHGVHHQQSDTATVIEIGGQDSKVLRLSRSGSVRDFSMNDRCAAGTGRFLELVADRLHVSLDEFNSLAGRSTKPAIISSMCAVFAETEIIGLLAEGTQPEDIITGVEAAIATRVSVMATGVAAPVVFTGGVALIPGMAKALERCLNIPVVVAENPQFTGAVGAAILACKRMKPETYSL